MKDRKTFFLMIITLLFFYSCSQTAKNRENYSKSTEQEKASIDKDWLIEEGSIEGFEIGESYSEKSGEFTYEKKLREFYTDESVDTMNVVSVSDQKEWLFDIVLQDHNIQKLKIESDKCKTKHGISINSTLTDFTKVYPDFEISFSYISGSFWVSTESLKMVHFYLDDECYKGPKEGLYDSDMVILNPKDFDKNCRITGITIL
jgi:hypothetical protein